MANQDKEKQELLSSERGEETRGGTSKLGLFTLVGFSIVICQIFCEVGKQVTNYSIQYYNGGKYPLPQTIIVVLVELLKLLCIVIWSGFKRPSFSSGNIRSSLKYLLPSLMYAVNNNLYMYGLILVPPPIWIILTSFRTVVTASLYKFILKREVTFLQFIGALLIVTSIVVAKVGDVVSAGQGNVIPLIAILLAMVASFISVGAAVYMESLFKTSGQNFSEQQFWLYFYGALVASAVHVVTATTINPLDSLQRLLEGSEGGAKVQGFFVVACLFSSVGGLVVAAVLKKLDNIVKEYSSATANIFTAIFCSLLFPEKFSITLFIILAMMLLFVGIYLYETAKPKTTKISPISDNGTEGRNGGKSPGSGV